MEMTFGNAVMHETISQYALDGSKTEDLMDCDGIIDMTASVSNIEQLYWFRDGKDFSREMPPYVCYRNGYNAFAAPRIHLQMRHYTVPSLQNMRIFNANGHDATCVYYGCPPMYKKGDNPEFWKYFEEEFGLKKKEYFLFPHRPTADKGIDMVKQLASRFPNETFVLSAATPIAEHQAGLTKLLQEASTLHMENIKYCPIPMNPMHHYYKRELMRHAKAGLTCFDPSRYIEGFNLTNMEFVANGTPIIVTDSESSRELWVHGKDAIIVPYHLESFSAAIEKFSTYSFNCHNNYTTENYAKNYLNLLLNKYANSPQVVESPKYVESTVNDQVVQFPPRP